MREIKFRAWVFGGLDEDELPFMTGVRSITFNAYAGPIILWRDHEEISYASEYRLMQYTGLHDKNGKEIYEGDVVRPIDSLGGRYTNVSEVRFSRGQWVIANFYNLPEDALYTRQYAIEIVGNIYENPELLEA